MPPKKLHNKNPDMALDKDDMESIRRAEDDLAKGKPEG